MRRSKVFLLETAVVLADRSAQRLSTVVPFVDILLEGFFLAVVEFMDHVI